MSFKIIHNRPECIGCGSCASMCDKYWKMDTDGKATLIGSKKEGTKQVLIVEEKDCAEEAMNVCPVEVISIKEVK